MTNITVACSNKMRHGTFSDSHCAQLELLIFGIGVCNFHQARQVKQSNTVHLTKLKRHQSSFQFHRSFVHHFSFSIYHASELYRIQFNSLQTAHFRRCNAFSSMFRFSTKFSSSNIRHKNRNEIEPNSILFWIVISFQALSIHVLRFFLSRFVHILCMLCVCHFNFGYFAQDGNAKMLDDALVVYSSILFISIYPQIFNVYSKYFLPSHTSNAAQM